MGRPTTIARNASAHPRTGTRTAEIEKPRLGKGGLNPRLPRSTLPLPARGDAPSPQIRVKKTEPGQEITAPGFRSNVAAYSRSTRTIDLLVHHSIKGHFGVAQRDVSSER